MATTEAARPGDGGPVSIGSLGRDDIGGGLELSALAGWNQCERDWAMMLRAGAGFAVRAGDRLVATAMALPYPPDFGWISMVLVHPDWRRRGLATRLLELAIGHLAERDLTAMLDATPAGAGVYRPLGFRDIEPISRWRGSGGRPAGGSPPAPLDVPRICDADRAAFGADRSAILADLAARRDGLAMAGPGGAFLLSRAGRTASQIGPVVASEESDAVDLLDEAISAIGGPLLVDVPDRNSLVTGLLGRRGFVVERPFIRMARGRRTGFGNPAHIRAIAGPELG